MTPSGLGICVPWQTEPILSLSKVRSLLKPKWMYNYFSNQIGEGGYVPMLWRPTPGDAQWVAAAADVRATGRFYLLFNEPEYSGQSNTAPEVAAAICNQWRNATRVKVNGQFVYPAWGGVGLLVNDEGIDKSLAYADAYLAAGGKVPPVWHIHIYAWSASHFEALWHRWFAWMYNNRVKYPGVMRPTLVTECASWDSTPARQIEVMQKAHAMIIADKWLEGVCWFSSLYGSQKAEWKRSDAFTFRVSGESITSDGTLTPVGDALKQLNTSTLYFPLAASEDGANE